MKPSADDLQVDDVCLLFALPQEARPLLREFPPQERFGGAPCRARFCGPSWLTILVLEAGMGAAAAETSLAWALGEPRFGNLPYRPKLVLSVGFCGGLHPDLKVGDVVLATEVVDEQEETRPTTWPGELPPGEWRPPLHRGRILTTAHIVASADEKAALGRRYDALAVDLESAPLAALCRKRDVPFGVVRAVSDDCRTSLSPALAALLAGGQPTPWRVGLAALGKPALFAEFWRLSRQGHRAAEQLALALGELLTLTLPWSENDQA
jgi:adenosylhomocysteine nucleosidase